MYVGCKKDPAPVLSRATKHAPTAKINGDTINVIADCPESGTILLDGSASTNADDNISSYKWNQISGPVSINFENPSYAKTKVSDLVIGQYIIVLTVSDTKGFFSKDTVWINVIASGTTYEYNLDLEANDTFSFKDNMEVCPWECYFADVTSITTSSPISSSGNMQISIYEETDSSVQAYQVNGFTAFRLSNELYAIGISSFDLKKVIQQGGGSFTGTIKLSSSSALGTCRENIFASLPPLTVNGILDTTTHMVNMRIKGKIIF